MRRTLMALAAASMLLAGCAGVRPPDDAAPSGRAPSADTATSVVATTVPAPRASPDPPGAPPATATTGAPPLDLAPVDALLASVDRALVDAEPGAEDDPSR